jgi:hypothetical protein
MDADASFPVLRGQWQGTWHLVGWANNIIQDCNFELDVARFPDLHPDLSYDTEYRYIWSL